MPLESNETQEVAGAIWAYDAENDRLTIKSHSWVPLPEREHFARHVFGLEASAARAKRWRFERENRETVTPYAIPRPSNVTRKGTIVSWTAPSQT
jgi:hypothetical protein